MYPAQTRGKSRGEQNKDLMEGMVSRQNMLKALRRVEKNKGARGRDNLTVEGLKPHLRQNWLSIREQLLKGEYKPQPVLRVGIPKPNGEKRLLEIPTVIGRFTQQALLQILTDIFALDFSPSGVMVNGVKVLTREGTPQGGPLSPLLANILLDDLDKELERRGHRFVRYADDSNIYLKSKRAGQRVMESITTFLKVKLRLKVNLQKSVVDISDNRKFLGFNLYHYHERIRIRIAPQAIKGFKIKIREITSRSNGQNIIKRILRLNLYLRGWMQYFSLSDTPYILKMLEG